MKVICKKNPGVYKIINMVNNKEYVGSSKNVKSRLQAHFNDLKKGIHYNKHLQFSFNKYGEDNFTYEIVEYIEKSENLRKDLLEREQYWINLLIKKDELHMYNICRHAGSCLGIKLTEAHKDKIRKAMTGEKNHMYGKDVSIETRKKLSQANKNRTKEFNKENGKRLIGNKYRLGKIMSDESRKKISNGNKGKHFGQKHSEEYKKSLSILQTGSKLSEETKQKIRENNVGKHNKINIDINEIMRLKSDGIFIKDIAKYFNVCKVTIYKIINEHKNKGNNHA